MSPLPQRMVNRWARRKMLSAGQGQLYWHLLLADQPEVKLLVQDVHRRLSIFPGLDPTPHALIHLTMLIAGLSHEISDDQVKTMTDKAAILLSRIDPIRLTFGRVLYHPEAIAIKAQPAENLHSLLDALRAATYHATGRYGVQADPWIPHITVAYSAADGPAAPIIESLGKGLPEATITLRNASLVRQDGPENAWDWRRIADVPIGDG